ncbi:hypothetical protein CTI14_00245 [Methylobacterium radiotolerans]|nr:hypothetical protein CTI14_00245 [Methylobacterium radiotolerans]
MPTKLSAISRPAFMVYGPASVTPPAVQLWQTEVFDNTNSFDLPSGRFTAPVAGLYFFAASVVAEPGTAGQAAAEVFAYRKNGAKLYTRTAYSGVTTAHTPITATLLIKLAQGDVIDLYLSASATLFQANDALSSFSGFLVG